MKERYQEKKCMMQNLKNGEGIQHLLDEAYKILGNPIMMFDTSYSLLAHTDTVVDDWVWNEILELGTFSQETVDFFNREKFIEAFAVSETVAYMKSAYLKYDRYNGKLFDKDNVQLGNISIVSCFTPFEEGDAALITLFCEILSVELQESEVYQKIDRVYQESFINQLISGHIAENEISNDMLAALYDGLKTNLYLAAVDITQYDPTNTHLAYFRDLFRKIQGEYKYYIHLNNIVILISTDNEVLHIKNDLGKLNKFFEKYEVYAGISSTFQNMMDASKYFKEAITALNYGLDSRRRQYIYCYDDFKVAHFLYSAVEYPGEISSPVVLSMQKYDEENNSTLLDILYVYLSHGMNFSAVCDRTHMPPEALSRALREMEDLFDIDWTNGDMLFNIFISVKFMDKA